MRAFCPRPSPGEGGGGTHSWELTFALSFRNERRNIPFPLAPPPGSLMHRKSLPIREEEMQISTLFRTFQRPVSECIVVLVNNLSNNSYWKKRLLVNEITPPNVAFSKSHIFSTQVLTPLFYLFFLLFFSSRLSPGQKLDQKPYLYVVQEESFS